VCEWLLSPEVGLGARQLQADGDGNTPSLMARLEGHTALADWLLDAEQHAGGLACRGEVVPGAELHGRDGETEAVSSGCGEQELLGAAEIG
jgi:hypothetical protein